ncbi:TPA: hypothetical protein N2898_004599 [Vibrio parahaemolyticus]|uniref:DUF6864 domain-containing function n=1 Tax=Vibrio parahaemolyticus TaxID=670 RepID=UPI003B66F5A1|nr:hypothetical protein [Vibrio parahaemolyticus]HCH0770773.1 hypothetical protein [Vibrio parahaemolyticus]HCH1007559.1 hypothetical protein [Vibrio parahaemolyticus]HCM1290483.1 hypothetical protein [Vibrio parahaemolyticus]
MSDSKPKVTLVVDEKEVLTSGIAHLDGTKSVSLKVEDLSIKFLFENDGSGSRYTGRAIGNTELELTLWNFNNSLGEGKLDPIPIGQLEGKKLFLSFYVNTLSEKENVRRFEYVLYLG